MSHPVFISMDNTNLALAQMASLSVDGLKSLANLYRSTIHQLAANQTKVRYLFVCSFAMTFFAILNAGVSKKRGDSDFWAIIAITSGSICVASLFPLIIYGAQIADKSFYLQAAQTLLLSKV